MAFALEPTRSVPVEVRRVVAERLSEAITIIDRLPGSEAAEIEDAVHDVRKRCKEVRAVARLVRPSIGQDFARFNVPVREAASTLAPIRDAHAVLATFDDLRAARAEQADQDLLRVRTGQTDLAEHATKTVHGGDPRLGQARELLRSARKRAKRWDLVDGFVPLAVGLDDTYRRGRTALRRARAAPSDDRLHEWRKAVKDLWYQVRLVERAAPSILSPLVAALDDLAEALGDDHDLAVLVERLRADPERFGGKQRVRRATRLARRQQDDLRGRAFRLGATIYAEKPTAFTTRVTAYWERAVRDGPELATGGIAGLAADDRRHASGAGDRAASATAERERKFLVDVLPPLPDRGASLRQGYLAIDRSVSVRVRDEEHAGCTLTVKAGRGAVRTELEFPLDAAQFAAAWEQTGGRRIHKTRHRVLAASHIVELDIFHDDLEGLTLAEVEFETDEAMASFVAPSWFGPEVTDDIAYTNASLAVNAPRGQPAGDAIA